MLKRRSRTGRVLILGNDDRVLLAVIRSLGRYGLKVHAAWADPALPAIESRYLHDFHDLPPYAENDSGWVEALNRLVRTVGFDLVIPCNDYAVLPLQVARQELDPGTDFVLLDDVVYRCVSDKQETIERARRLGIPTPRQWRWPRGGQDRNGTEPIFDRATLESVRFPLFIKPRSSITRLDE